MRTLPRFLLTLAALTALTAGAAIAAPGRAPEVMRWTVDGVDREALVFVPAPGAAGVRVPLVFGFHGHGGTMRSSARAFAIQDVWPGALVVYPQGLDTATRVDPRGRFPGWQRSPGDDGDRDLKLVDAMLKSLRARYPVDDRRIYAMGFSNGAIFTYLLWATRAATFAAFAPCAGAIWDGTHLAEPKPLLEIGGERDRIVKYPLQAESIAKARALDGATGAGAACGTGCTLYPSTRNAPVETITHPGGHVFPAWAGGRIVEFFQAHPRTP